jgi:anti-anti-sigma regulatory factor
VESAGGLGSADHVCWSYRDEASFRRAALEFLTDGRRLRQRLAYAGARPPAVLRDHVSELEDAPRLLAAGALSIRPLGTEHGERGSLVAEREVDGYAARVRSALDDGFTGLRVAADVTPLLSEPATRAEFVRTEQLAERYMARGHPLAAMCGYDESVLGHAVEDVLCVHPVVHTTDAVVPFQLYGDGEDLVLRGEVDLFTAPRLARALARAGVARQAILDVAGLEFADHHALQTLGAHAERVAAAGGRLTLRGAPAHVRRIWSLLDIRGAGAVRWA